MFALNIHTCPVTRCNLLLFYHVFSDESESAKLLIEAGADINAKNHKGASPIIIAAVKGNQSVLRLLANNPNIKLNDQVVVLFVLPLLCHVLVHCRIQMGIRHFTVLYLLKNMSL